MDLATLQKRVDGYVKVDLRPLYEAYRAEGGTDLDGFVAYLGAARAIDPVLVKELHTLGGVETPSLEDPAYQGTLLASWARTVAPRQAHDAASGRASAPAITDRGSDVRFRTISRLGEGAMGAVDIARDVYLRRKVALKTVLPEMAAHPEAFARFLSEMQITAQLEHPNIVPVYALDVGTDGSLGYAMKLVQGRDLATIIDEAREKSEKGEPLGEELELEKRLEYFLKVCDALAYAHDKGIVHRDLKPANIMIGRHNEVYLMDWGIARPIGAGGQPLEAGFDVPEASDRSSSNLGRTRIGDAIGTPPYMSPEQAAGKNPELDGKSDQYTMGLILQECVTLKTAVDGASIEAVLIKALTGKRDIPPVGDGPGAMPRELDAVVRKATSFEPKDRYPSVRELADDVRRHLRGEAVLALPEGKVRRAGRFLAKHRMATLTLVLGLGLVGAGGTIGALIAGQARIDAQHARELRVSQMAAESAIQAQLVDRELGRYEAALTEFIGAAQIVLSKLPASDVAPYFDESFGAKASAPPDFGPAPRYRRDVSVLAPVTALGAGTAREPLEPLLRSLGLLGPAFRELMLGTASVDARAASPAEQRALITDTGVPAFRASIALREGVSLSFPGMAGRAPITAPKEPDPKRGVVWGAATIVDGEPILPASAALYDERGAFRGTAHLEVSLSKLLARPAAADLDYVQSRLIIARDGKVLAEDNKAEGRVPLAPEVGEAMAAGKTGTLVAEVNGRRYRYAFQPLAVLDGYYVAAAEEGRMTGSKAKLETSDPRKAVEAPAPKPLASSPARPAATPNAPAPVHDAGAEIDAGEIDAGEAADAGPARKLGPMPKSSTDPGEAPLPPNPFEKWKAYDRKKKP
ncbi:Serine/threonine protein kinase PrkC, regulator of stationary phase [Minicystis rosea]|nr:Serine/threonine protein kinase PrkC, regulator of stationary phase [Minicystis rosea]